MSQAVGDEVAARLELLGQVMAAAQDDWCLIGGAALAVLGVPGVPVRDIDVLLSVADAKRIMGQLGVVSSPDRGSGRFCSQVYAQVGETIQFDFMAGLKVRADDAWVPVLPCPTSRVMFGEWPIYLPSRADMAAILRLFGRPKDLARLDLLERNIRP